MAKQSVGRKSAVKMSAAERISVGTFPTGISYVDRSIEIAGDYKRIAFLPFSTLALEWYANRVPEDVRKYIMNDAAKIAARRGQDYQVSSSGQTVRLGPGGEKTPAQLNREIGELLTAAPAQASRASLVSPPSATILLRRRGRYVDDDAVMIGTSMGDAADSHGAVYRALKIAKIQPIHLGGSFKVTFDPNETDGEAAVAIVGDALRSAGISVYRIDLRSAR